MRDELARATRAGVIAAIRLGPCWIMAERATHQRSVAFIAAGFGLTVVLVSLVTLSGVDWFVPARRDPEPATGAGERLTMLGPVWIEHPESDVTGPPRRFA